MRDIPNLDFMRSIAVLSVVVEHMLLAFGVLWIGPFPVEFLGLMGVLIFFVLTSLVLMWSLERKPHTLDFYIRRVFRIYPLVLVGLAVVLVFHAPVGGTPEQYFHYQHPALRDILIHVGLMQDLFDIKFSMMSVLWSLPLEVQMYLFLPVLFFFVQRNFSLWPLLLLWGFAVMVDRHMPNEARSFAIAVPFFLPGIMAYVGFGRWKPRFPAWLLPVCLLLLWTFFLYHCSYKRGWYFCLIVGLSLPLFHQIRSKTVVVVSKQIAKYSYGVYVTHPFALVIGLYLLREHSLPLRLFAVLVPLVVLPLLAYHLVEHPMIRLGSRLAAKAEAKYEQRQLQHFRQAPSK